MKILFCGVGALGSTAATLCRNLPADLAFVDHDRVESKNLLSQAYARQAVGRNKAEALRLQLLNFHGIKTAAYGVRVVDTNIDTLADGVDLLVDCFDNRAGREVLSRYARRTGTALVHAGISGDGDFGLVRWEERFTADEEDAPGQATCAGGEHLPMIGQIAAALARVVQDFVTDRVRRDVLLTLTGASSAVTDRPVTGGQSG